MKQVKFCINIYWRLAYYYTLRIEEEPSLDYHPPSPTPLQLLLANMTR